MSTQLDHPAKVKMIEVLINNEDVIGLFVSIEIFENIFIGGVTGSITIMDNDGVSFIEEQELEFIEEISFTFINVNDDEIKFEGYMNGLRNEVTSNQIKMYTIDFTSKSVRKNEVTFVNKAFRNVSPEEIVTEMVEERLSDGAEGNKLILGSNPNSGEKMTWVAGNRKPIDVIRYVLNHGVAMDGNPQYTKGDQDKSKSSGTSGFLCWETLDGYRFSSMKSIFEENNFGETHTDYANYLANTPVGYDIKTKTIMTYDFPKVGDYFEKARSGAVKSKLVSFDLDTGILSNFSYEAAEGDVTKKLLDHIPESSRTIVRMFANEKFRNDCEREQNDVGDQSRKYLSQTISRQNTFCDTHGRITLPAQYNIRAGDLIDINIYKIQYRDTSKEPQKKHSGRYLISQVGHHFFRDGYSYTKLALIRDNKRQDKGTSQ